MRFREFERIISTARMGRYVSACGGDTRKAMTLYRKNLKLSQELFTVEGCFEIALRNAIDEHYWNEHGSHWLRDAAGRGGIFDNQNCHITGSIITEAISNLGRAYTHQKLVAELGFGFWRYMFATHQYRAGGQTLLATFPLLPTSTPAVNYGANFIFNQLAKVNKLRNRIAHHEPVCFTPGRAVINTTYARQNYALLLQLFQWMSIDEASLLYGLDKVLQTCDVIDSL
jgi:hypothetical protein